MNVGSGTRPDAKSDSGGPVVVPTPVPRAGRTVTLQLAGPLAQEGKVPISLLAEKLNALQRALFNIGSSLRGGGRRGTWKTEVLQACQLLFVETRRHSLEIVAEVAPSPALSPPELDLGSRALDRLSDTLQAVTAHDSTLVYNLYPDFGQRVRVIKSFLPLLPEEGSDYDVLVSADATTFQMDSRSRPFFTRLVREEGPDTPEEAVRTLTGRLFRIEVETGQRQLGLKVNNRQIRCFYPEDLEDIARDLVPGSLVEVEGRATLDERGEVAQIEQVFDARTIQLIPLYWQRVIYSHRCFRLRRPIQIRVDFHESLWIHEYEPLGILAYAPTRSESLEMFRLDFVAAWDAVAHEDDTNLTEDARTLKRALQDLVEHEDGVA